MGEEERDNINLIRISSVDEQQQQRNPRPILETSPSTISFVNSYVPPNVIDVLDEIYSNRTHRKCITISYLTLLSMAFSVIFWISYWLIYSRCQSLENSEWKLFVCDLVTIFEILIFTSLGILPLLFILMIYCWIYYSCYNPMDFIRQNHKGFKIEGNQWKEQLNSYYYNNKIKYWNCFHYKQRKELYQRGYGYIILSSHGIVIDELILLSAKKNIIQNGIILQNNKLLKLYFKRTWTRPWKIKISIYLPDHSIDAHDMEELHQLFKIQTNPETVSPESF